MFVRELIGLILLLFGPIVISGVSDGRSSKEENLPSHDYHPIIINIILKHYWN